MSFTRLAGLAGALALLPLTAQAEFAGGRATLSHSTFTEDTDLAKSTAAARLEWDYGRFGYQLDLGLSGLHALDDTALNFTSHLVYHLNTGASVGLFYGWDKVVGSEDFFGVELASEVGRVEVEGYVAMIDQTGSNGTLLGLSGHMPLNERFGLGLSLDHINADTLADATRLGLSGDYAVGEKTRLFAEVGLVDGDDGKTSISDPYVKLGADFSFGAKGDTSFGSRSIFNFIPGL